jgi:SAM-dependent methyltransferase
MRCEPADELPDGRLAVSSADRNRGPILKVLERVLPKTGLVLEVASGTGQHVVHFAQALKGLSWQPTEMDAACRRSISAWLATAELANVRQPLDLDVRALPWRVPTLDAIVCLNLIHIAPWSVATALFAGAGLALRETGLLYLYGPYSVQGRHTAPSNAAFDGALRAENPEWGLRDLKEVESLAKDQGFDPAETIEMPANNFSVLFRKRRMAGHQRLLRFYRRSVLTRPSSSRVGGQNDR